MDRLPGWPLWTVLAVLAALLGGSALPAAAGESNPAATVDAFYRWYLAHHGRVETTWSDVRWLFDADLFEEIDQTYFKDDYRSNDILVSSCRETLTSCPASYDFFANARLPATSYAVGATTIENGEAVVRVTLRVPSERGGYSHASVVLHRAGDRYVIGNLLFEEPRYYYAGAIVDLVKFLGAYNC